MYLGAKRRYINTLPFLFTRVHNPNGISIGSAIFAGFTIVTYRQTDHATRSVTTGRIYVRSTVMRPNKIIATVFSCGRCHYNCCIVAFNIKEL